MLLMSLQKCKSPLGGSMYNFMTEQSEIKRGSHINPAIKFHFAPGFLVSLSKCIV